MVPLDIRCAIADVRSSLGMSTVLWSAILCRGDDVGPDVIIHVSLDVIIPHCTLAGAFVSVLRAGMLEGVSREDGQNADKPEKTDRARERGDRHGVGSSGRGGGKWFRHRDGDCIVVRRIRRCEGMASG